MNTQTRSHRAGTADRRREPLSRERIIETALRIMDAEGLDALSMRRIGRELGVEAMSLYNHVEDKDDILEGLTERVMSDYAIPRSTGDWAEDGRVMAREWRRLLRLHPGVMQLLAERHKPLEGLATWRTMDAALGVLRQAGLSSREAAQAFNAMGAYIFGYVMMEQGLMLGNADDHAKDREVALATLQGAGVPNVLECLPHFADCPSDEQFEFGLDLLIRGIRERVEDRTTR